MSREGVRKFNTLGRRCWARVIDLASPKPAERFPAEEAPGERDEAFVVPLPSERVKSFDLVAVVGVEGLPFFHLTKMIFATHFWCVLSEKLYRISGNHILIVCVI